MKCAAVVCANGFEDIEAITVIDILRRVDVKVLVTALQNKEVISSHSLSIMADILIRDVPENIDAIVLPGGLPGAQNIADESLVHEVIKRMLRKNKLVAAICAAPGLVLGSYMEGFKGTCYPGFETYFHNNAQVVSDKVVVDKNIITSRGPATAMDFALTIVEYLVGKDKAIQVSSDLLKETY